VLGPPPEQAQVSAAVPAAAVSAALSAPGEQLITPLIAQAVPVMSPLAAAPLAQHFAEVRPRAPSRAVQLRPAPTSRAAAYARRSPAYARPASHTRRAEPVDITRPRLISPEDGRRGKLVLLVEVKKNGKVGDVDLLSSDLDRKNRSHRDLQRAAISTVKRWRYEPAIRAGAPADTQIRVVVNIDLDSSRVGFTEANARRRAMAANRAADSVLAAR
jgi:TonB family protein